MSNSRELSKIFSTDTTLATDTEMLVMVTSASTNAMNQAMSYVDSEMASIDLSSTIITASAAAYTQATGYSDNQLNSASTSLTNTINNLTTSDIEEGTNKYFTNQRAIDAGSATYLPYVGGNISAVS